MLLLISAVKLVAELALLALLGQALLGWLAGAHKERNLFYQLLALMGRPFVRAAGWISPAFVLPQHHPLVALCLLSVVWLAALLAKISVCVSLGVAVCR
jgi:hypothetical protein